MLETSKEGIWKNDWKEADGKKKFWKKKILEEEKEKSEMRKNKKKYFWEKGFHNRGNEADQKKFNFCFSGVFGLWFPEFGGRKPEYLIDWLITPKKAFILP